MVLWAVEERRSHSPAKKGDWVRRAWCAWRVVEPSDAEPTWRWMIGERR